MPKDTIDGHHQLKPYIFLKRQAVKMYMQQIPLKPSLPGLSTNDTEQPYITPQR